jgi:hypothetical protein
MTEDSIEQQLLQTITDYQKGIQETLDETRKPYEDLGSLLLQLAQEACAWQKRAAETAIHLHKLVAARDKAAATPAPSRYRHVKHNASTPWAFSGLTQSSLSLIQRGYRRDGLVRNVMYPWHYRAVVLGLSIRHAKKGLGKDVPHV